MTVARREAWRQNALEIKEREAVRGEDLPMDAVDPRDRHGEALEFRAAIDELKKLPPLLQEVVVMNSQVHRQQDVADLMGLSRQRVAYLLVQAAQRVAQLNEERHDAERPVASPRAARLRELEEDPPEWLMSAVGRRPGRTKSDSASVLGWRRAALVIDDFRQSYGYDSRTDAIGAIPIDPVARRSYQRAERAIANVIESRERRKGISRGR